ncbi:hypothetical protein GCM10011380_13460 [Sphingomonas metalli]|jgi:predicted transcriptional regulator|uniref:Uncharacterized protein n=1 Tax=Sphingomonas metalli TaxID=1779358 RepID=A0A916SZU6_9SPHN|nr:hypothetical protein [Sphingomonas metalli]GGB25186.1 hypothetical protein GCM10011380_13460 [Sphingomonas metalli]
MTMPVSLPIHVDAELLALAEQAAEWRHLTLEAFVNAVIRRAAEADLRLAAKIHEAEESLDRGEFHTQEEVEAWFAQQIGQAAAE